MLNFNLCYHKDCRKKVEYLAKDGMGYCSRHSMMIVEGYGIEEFWPHYHLNIKRDLVYKKRKEDKDKRDRLEKEVMMNLDKERRRTYR